MHSLLEGLSCHIKRRFQLIVILVVLGCVTLHLGHLDHIQQHMIIKLVIVFELLLAQALAKVYESETIQPPDAIEVLLEGLVAENGLEDGSHLLVFIEALLYHEVLWRHRVSLCPLNRHPEIRLAWLERDWLHDWLLHHGSVGSSCLTVLLHGPLEVHDLVDPYLLLFIDKILQVLALYLLLSSLGVLIVNLLVDAPASVQLIVALLGFGKLVSRRGPW